PGLASDPRVKPLPDKLLLSQEGVAERHENGVIYISPRLPWSLQYELYLHGLRHTRHPKRWELLVSVPELLRNQAERTVRLIIKALENGEPGVPQAHHLARRLMDKGVTANVVVEAVTELAKEENLSLMADPVEEWRTLILDGRPLHEIELDI